MLLSGRSARRQASERLLELVFCAMLLVLITSLTSHVACLGPEADLLNERRDRGEVTARSRNFDLDSFTNVAGMNGRMNDRMEMAEGVQSDERHVFNITDYGAVGDGVTNCTQAFQAAIRAASKAVNHSTVYVPAGKFLTSPLRLDDCKNTWLVIEGTVLAPSETADWHGKNHLIKFTEPTNCSVLGVSGTASIDGVGAVWWASEAAGNSSRPDLLIFKGGMHGYPQPSVFNISLVNAPGAHIKIQDTVMYAGVEIVGVMIEANDDKHADGIVAINASFLVDRSSISVGGTNVLSKTEYGDSSRSFFGLTQVVLSKGDGLQMLVTDGILANVSTWDVSMKNTRYGVSLLGARDGSGMVEQMDMEQITMDGVGTPIVVDNTHCPPSHHGCTHPARGVKLSIVMDDISATQTSGSAGEFQCGQPDMCFVALDNVTVPALPPATGNAFHCSNVTGQASDTVKPPACFPKSVA